MTKLDKRLKKSVIIKKIFEFFLILLLLYQTFLLFGFGLNILKKSILITLSAYILAIITMLLLSVLGFLIRIETIVIRKSKNLKTELYLIELILVTILPIFLLFYDLLVLGFLTGYITVNSNFWNGIYITSIIMLLGLFYILFKQNKRKIFLKLNKESIS